MAADTFLLHHNGLWYHLCTLAKDLTPTKMSVLYKSTHTAQIILPSVAGGGVGVAESAESCLQNLPVNGGGPHGSTLSCRTEVTAMCICQTREPIPKAAVTQRRMCQHLPPSLPPGSKRVASVPENSVPATGYHLQLGVVDARGGTAVTTHHCPCLRK